MYDVKNYVADAVRTRPPQQPLSAEDSVLLLAAIGMVGETGEVFEAAETFSYNEKREGGNAKFIKELGDVTWYAAALVEAKGFNLMDMLLPGSAVLLIKEAVVEASGSFATAMDNFTKDLLKYTTAVSEHIKKEVFHRHPPTDLDLMQKVARVFQTVQLGAALLGFSIDYVFEQNIAKLRERYPERFETSLSINKKAD